MPVHTIFLAGHSRPVLYPNLGVLQLQQDRISKFFCNNETGLVQTLNPCPEK
jgi:hypothetical protein